MKSCIIDDDRIYKGWKYAYKKYSGNEQGRAARKTSFAFCADGK